MRHFLPSRQQQKQKVTSISYSTFGIDPKTKIKKIKNLDFNSYEVAKAKLPHLHSELREKLTSKGDPKISNYDNIASDFITTVGEDIKSQKGKRSISIHDIVDHFNLNEADLKDCETVEDLGYTAIFKEQLKLLCEKINIDYQDCSNKIRSKDIPSWSLAHELDRICKKSKRADGSDLNDNNLAVFCFYADYTFVDKRTFAFLNQIFKINTELAFLTNKYYKVSDYIKICDIIT